MSTHYDVLGVDRDAEAKEIRAAYRRRAKLLHPDANPGSAASLRRELEIAMGALNEAWRVLGDPVLRRDYDAELARGADLVSTTRWASVVTAGPRTVRKRVVEPLINLGPGFYNFATSRYASSPTARRTLNGVYVGVEPGADLARLRLLEPREIFGVHASRTGIGDADLGHVAGLTNLKILNLAFTHVGDDGLGHLAAMRKLESLDLCGTAVGDDGLRRLTGIGSLAYLNLCATRVTDAGIAHLRALPRLSVLVLRETAVTGKGLRSLEGLDHVRLIGLPPHVSWRDRLWLRGAFHDVALT